MSEGVGKLEEVVEVGDDTGNAEHAGATVSIRLRGAAEERSEGGPAQELGLVGNAGGEQSGPATGQR